jgi:hypothetical protein
MGHLALDVKSVAFAMIEIKGARPFRRSDFSYGKASPWISVLASAARETSRPIPARRFRDFLFKLQERAGFEKDIQVLVDGKDIVPLSDGIHGELFGPEGRASRFSLYGESRERLSNGARRYSQLGAAQQGLAPDKARRCGPPSAGASR